MFHRLPSPAVGLLTVGLPLAFRRFQPFLQKALALHRTFANDQRLQYRKHYFEEQRRLERSHVAVDSRSARIPGENELVLENAVAVGSRESDRPIWRQRRDFDHRRIWLAHEVSDRLVF